MKTYLLPVLPALAIAAFLNVSASADPTPAAPAPAAPAPIVTSTDHPAKAPVEGTAGQTKEGEKASSASPTGAVKNMAPVRGEPSQVEVKSAPADPKAGSTLTVPRTSSVSNLGSGSNSTLGDKKADDKTPAGKP